MSSDPVTERIIGAAIDVHKALGPGLLESAYETCLCHELAIRNISFQKQVPIAVVYKDMRLDCGFRADIIVDSSVVVEIKAVERLMGIHDAQLLTYLRLAQISTGLLINFNTSLLKDGIRRLVV